MATSDGLRELDGEPVDLTADEQATLEALKVRVRQARGRVYQDADELPDEVDQRLGEIEAALSAFDTRPLSTSRPTSPAPVFSSASTPKAALLIDRGYVRPEDEAPVVSRSARPSLTLKPERQIGARRCERPLAPSSVRSSPSAARRSNRDEDEDDAIKPLPDRLITELTAHRTLALRDALANEPAIAFTGGAAQFRAGDLLPLRDRRAAAWRLRSGRRRSRLRRLA